MVALAVSTMVVSACSPADPKPVIRTEVIKPVVPQAARQRCSDPVPLPDRAMPAEEVTSKWGADRASLRICEQRRAAAVAAADGVTHDP